VAAAFAEKLVEACSASGMKKVFLCNSGAEANEGACKIARKYSLKKYGEGRHTIVTLRGSFHGRTITTLAATGQEKLHRDFGPFTEGFKHIEGGDTAALEKARVNPFRKDAVPSPFEVRSTAASASAVKSDGSLIDGLVLTTGPGSAMSIVKVLLETVQREIVQQKNKAPFHLIITAGGDGTSLEALQSLYDASAEACANCAILRLPLGTGNDGAEAWELEDALEFLLKPVRVEKTCGLKLSTAAGKTWSGGGPFLAFNILSVGLDAFVTHMTNKMKGKLPGDSYKLWVDMAALFYDRIYKVGPMSVAGYDGKGKEVQAFREKLLLCAMGVSGHRSYGSHQMILPDGRNVCALKQMSLFKKIAIKDIIITGGHAAKPESILFNAGQIVVSCEYPILAQMDGETVRLEKADFPVTIELTKPVIPVLKLAK
jgi:diacylglycerol kinase family enzyme